VCDVCMMADLDQVAVAPDAIVPIRQVCLELLEEVVLTGSEAGGAVGAHSVAGGAGSRGGRLEARREAGEEGTRTGNLGATSGTGGEESGGAHKRFAADGGSGGGAEAGGGAQRGAGVEGGGGMQLRGGGRQMWGVADDMAAFLSGRELRAVPR